MSTMKKAAPLMFVLALGIAACDDPLAPDTRSPYPVEAVSEGPWVPPSGSVLMQERGRFGMEWRGPAPASGWTEADVVAFADPDRIVGRSRMKRGAGQVSLHLTAGGMAPGEAATLWAVVFNDPEACVGECDDPDLFENLATRADLLYVAGGVANRKGEITYAGRLAEDETGPSIMPLFGLPAPGVLDAGTAEIHLVVRSHGPVIQGLRQAQVTTFNGGCTGFGSEFGTPGPNECVDLYFASHYAN
jgi:hypothetical protein